MVSQCTFSRNLFRYFPVMEMQDLPTRAEDQFAGMLKKKEKEKEKEKEVAVRDED